jgi:amidase
MAFPEYATHDALALAELVRTRQVTPLELVEEAIARIARVQPRLNAFVGELYDRARRDARGPLPDGPLAGVPLVVKDLVQPVEGAPFRRGSRLFAATVAAHDSELVRRYRRAGLLLVAKTATPELGLTPYTEPALQGPARNPWNPEHTTGGSSGGSAAAVAAGVVPMGHGGDGGGSIRIPAACCGMFGLKPTRGRTPPGTAGAEGWGGLSLDHAITRTVRDSAALLDASRGHAPGSPYDAPPVERPYLEEVGRAPGRLRIALCRTPLLPAQPHADVLAAVDDAARLAASLGHEVEEAAPPLDAAALARSLLTVISVSVALDVAAGEREVGRPAGRDDLELTTRLVAMMGRQATAAQLEQARRELHAVGRTMAEFFARYDVLLTPTLGQPPPRVGALQPHGLERRAQQLVADLRLEAVLRVPGLVPAIAAKTYGFIPWTPLANVAGLPSMSVPLWWNADGLPVGSMFTGRFGDEATLFRLAGQLEQARPWRHRRPAVFSD